MPEFTGFHYTLLYPYRGFLGTSVLAITEPGKVTVLFLRDALYKYWQEKSKKKNM